MNNDLLIEGFENANTGKITSHFPEPKIKKPLGKKVGTTLTIQVEPKEEGDFWIAGQRVTDEKGKLITGRQLSRENLHGVMAMLPMQLVDKLNALTSEENKSLHVAKNTAIIALLEYAFARLEHDKTKLVISIV